MEMQALATSSMSDLQLARQHKDNMCGIGGWFGATPDSKKSKELVSGMEHRGPDGSGVWEEGDATLVHTRLAIIDLSDAGSQPVLLSSVADNSPSAVLVFNGEIYNHNELRAELEAEGEQFHGHSDSEVLARLLSKHGTQCLPRLAGMFAFAYWDENKQTGILARDPYGIKSLYYHHSAEGSLSFASETKPLIKLIGQSSPDANALRDFFLWGSVPEPATLTDGVRQIPAGHFLSWENGAISLTPWLTNSVGKEEARKAEGTSVEQTRKALEESIRRHLVSDVPVGIFLSGGIDSTAVVALARQALGPDADLRTFSIGFDDPAFDESSMARRTAEHFGTRHTEWKMTSAEGAAEIQPFLEAVDQPSIDGFNTWCVSKLARREGMKVVLSGLGGDEFFAGYGSFQRVPKFRKLYRSLGPLRLVLAGVLARAAAGSPWRRLGAYLKSNGSALAAFHAQRGIFTEDEARKLVEQFLSRDPGPADWSDPVGIPKGGVEAVSHLEVSRYMRNQLLRDSDVFSMAHGLELRVPLVDARLYQALDGLSPEVRFRQGKRLLIEAVPEIPEWVWNQPKRGFRFPFQQWMEAQLGDMLREAQEESPVELKEWYRIWAVAAASRSLQGHV